MLGRTSFNQPSLELINNIWVKSAIERSMNLFGLPVESINWDAGYEKFLDVTLADY